MKVIPGHTCRVIKKTQLTKNMLRIDFEISQSNSAIVFKPGCYVKLHLPVANRKKPKVRTYTLKNSHYRFCIAPTRRHSNKLGNVCLGY